MVDAEVKLAKRVARIKNQRIGRRASIRFLRVRLPPPPLSRKIDFIWFELGASRGVMFRLAFKSNNMGNLTNTTTETQCQILQTTLLQGIVVGHEYAKAVLGIGSGFRTRVSNLRLKGLPIKDKRLSILNPHTGRYSRPKEYYMEPQDIARIKAERQAKE